MTKTCIDHGPREKIQVLLSSVWGAGYNSARAPHQVPPRITQSLVVLISWGCPSHTPNPLLSLPPQSAKQLIKRSVSPRAVIQGPRSHQGLCLMGLLLCIRAAGRVSAQAAFPGLCIPCFLGPSIVLVTGEEITPPGETLGARHGWGQTHVHWCELELRYLLPALSPRDLTLPFSVSLSPSPTALWKHPRVASWGRQSRALKTWTTLLWT